MAKLLILNNRRPGNRDYTLAMVAILTGNAVTAVKVMADADEFCESPFLSTHSENWEVTRHGDAYQLTYTPAARYNGIMKGTMTNG